MSVKAGTTGRAGRGQRWLEATLILLVAIVPWLPYLAGSVVLYFGDTFYYFYPLRHTLAAALHGGYFPDWESSVLSGNPFCANPQGNCYYPLSVWYLLEDFFSAYHWALVSHFVIGGAGVFVWLRRRGHAGYACLVAVAIFVLGGPTLSMVNRLDKLQSLCWWPWVMVGWEMLASRHRWGVACLAGALAMQFTAGGVEVWAFAIGAGAVWVMAANPGASRSATGLAALAALGLSLMLTAPQWAPFLELLHWSTRSGGVSFAKASAMSLSLPDLLGFIQPHLFFDPESLAYRPVPGGPTVPHYFYGIYVGWLALPAIATALPLALRREPHSGEVRAAVLLAAAGLFMALGSHNPLYERLYAWLPPLRAVRFPEKFFSLSAFFLLPLVATGLGRWRRTKHWMWAGGAGAAVALLASVSPGTLASIGSFFAQTLAGGTPGAWKSHLLNLRPEILRQGVFLAGAAATGYIAVRTPGSRLAAAGMVAAVAMDLWSGNWTLNPPMNRTTLDRPPDLATPLIRSLSPPRVHILPLYEPGPLVFPPGLGPEQSYAWLWQLLYPNTGLLSGVAYADGARALRLEHTTRFFAAMKGAPIETQLRLARIAGVNALVTARAAGTADLRRILEPDDAGDSPGRPDDPPAALTLLSGSDRARVEAWRVDDTAPPAYLVARCAWFPHRQGALSAVLSGDLNPGNQVALVKDTGPGVQHEAIPACSPRTGSSGSLAGASARPSGRARTEFRAVSIEASDGGKRKAARQVDAGEGAVLVIPEAWYPGWHARVDGKEVPVMLANGYQQAISLAAGRHDVILEFRPEGRTWQLGGTFCGLVLALASAWMPGVLGRTKKSNR